jgi:hypothetical protein
VRAFFQQLTKENSLLRVSHFGSGYQFTSLLTTSKINNLSQRLLR